MKKRIVQGIMVTMFLGILGAGSINCSPEIKLQSQEENVSTHGIEALGHMSDTQQEVSVSGYITDMIEVPDVLADLAESHKEAEYESDRPGEQFEQKSDDIVQLQKEVTLLGQSSIPISYDARNHGYITSVKAQQDNTCWAYSAVSMAESDMLAEQTPLDGVLLTTDTADFSEDYLIYSFYHAKADPLGNTSGDRTEALGWYRGVGGNHIFTTFGLANQIGLVKEELADGVEWEDEMPEPGDISESVVLKNAYWINLKQNQTLVKRMIMQHGSAAISLYYAAYYMQQEHAAYYNHVSTSVNHAAVIIGWDDTYPASNFKTDPGADGAWLVKNSYGSSAGDGYFWISYQDLALTSNTAKAFVFDFEAVDKDAYVYQHDGSAGAYMESDANDTGYRVASGASVANVFMVPADTPTGHQSLYAVSTALFAVNVDYRIQIYKNPTDASNPTSGTPMLQEPVTGKTTFAGYYTVPLPEEVVLSAGDTFSVVITLTKENGKDISYFIDKSYTNGGWISFVNEVESGESFAYENGKWTDLADTGATARVKAFTHDYQMPVQSLQLDRAKVQLWNTQTVGLRITILPQTATDKNVCWNSSDPAVAKVDEKGYVTATGKGTAVITVVSQENPQIKAKCVITVRQQADTAELSSKKTELTCRIGEKKKLKWKLFPGTAKLSSVSFQSSDEQIVTITKKGSLKGKKEGSAVINVISMYNGEVLASYPVTVIPSQNADADIPNEMPVLPDGDQGQPLSENEQESVETVIVAEKQASATGNKPKSLPKTSDTNMIVLWGILFIAACLLLVNTRNNWKKSRI